MSDDVLMSSEEQYRRARALLEDPLLRQVIREMDENAVMTWRRSTNVQQREDAWHMQTALAKFNAELLRRIEDAKVAEANERQQRRVVRV